MGTKEQNTISLVDFVRQERFAECAFCALPQDIRDQLKAGARKKGITREQRLRWLHAIGHQEITDEVYDLHVRGNHDQRMLP